MFGIDVLVLNLNYILFDKQCFFKTDMNSLDTCRELKMATMNAYINEHGGGRMQNITTNGNTSNLNSIEATSGTPMISQLNQTSNMYRENCHKFCFPNTKACCPGFYCPLLRSCMSPCQQHGSWCPSSDTVK